MVTHTTKTYEQLLSENAELTRQLEEANETIYAIRTGQVDAFVVQGENGHELYTLKTADSTYRIFIETMNEGAITLNRDGLIVYANSMFANMVGLPLSTVIGMSFIDFIPPESDFAYQNLFRLGWTEDNKIEIQLRASDRLLPCKLSANALELEGGVSLSMILTDLTVQKENQRLVEQKNEQLARINAALEISNHDLLQFASVASHDLQEPLRKMEVFGGMLRERHATDLPPDSLRQLDRIIDSARRMKTMIVDILAYSRLAKDNERFEPTPLNEVVADVLADFDLLIQEKQATVRVDSLPVIQAHRGQIRQVFQNLISNALKFSRSQIPPSIVIGGTVSGAYPATTSRATLTIRFTDNGIGFSKQYSERVFSLFERLNPKDAYEGSGIGLAIVKRIVERHHGTIKAESQEGVGTTFIIILPLA
jgi:PAS domain S-box-containing protein